MDLAHLNRLVSLNVKLPCDVHLPPATYIRKGVNLSVLLIALEQREGETDPVRTQLTANELDRKEIHMDASKAIDEAFKWVGEKAEPMKTFTGRMVYHQPEVRRLVELCEELCATERGLMDVIEDIRPLVEPCKVMVGLAPPPRPMPEPEDPDWGAKVAADYKAEHVQVDMGEAAAKLGLTPAQVERYVDQAIEAAHGVQAAENPGGALPGEAMIRNMARYYSNRPVMLPNVEDGERLIRSELAYKADVQAHREKDLETHHSMEKAHAEAREAAVAAGTYGTKEANPIVAKEREARVFPERGE